MSKAARSPNWLVSVCCSLLSLLMYGVVRLSGVMFVAAMDRYKVDRESASFPFTLADCMQAAIGPVTGYLAHKFGIKRVLIFGSLLSTLGIALCFVAEDIRLITFFWGVLFGLGFGLTSLLLPLIITQQFNTNQATALGVMYCGSYVGFFILPSLVQKLVDMYGLSGTYLLIAALIFHSVPLIMLINIDDISNATPNVPQNSVISENVEMIDDDDDPTKTFSGKFVRRVSEAFIKPVIENRRYSVMEENIMNIRKDRKESIKFPSSNLDNVSVSENGSVYSIHIDDSSQLGGNSPNVRRKLSNLLDLRRNSRQNSIADVSSDYRPNSRMNSIKGPMDHRISITLSSNRSPNMEELRKERLENIRRKLSVSVALSEDRALETILENANGKSPNFLSVDDFASMPQRKVSFSDTKIRDNTSSDVTIEIPAKLGLLDLYMVFLEPVYIFILFGYAVYAVTFIILVTIMVDFARDIGISVSDGNYAMMSFSVASNIGLLSFGWVTDYKFLKITTFLGILFIIRGMTLFFISFSGGFLMLVLLVSFQGLAEASISNLMPLLLMEYFCNDVQEVAVSSQLVLSAPFYLASPFLIGLFRDDLGSYRGLFYLMSSSSIFSSILIFLIPLLAKYRCGRESKLLRKKPRRDNANHVESS